MPDPSPYRNRGEPLDARLGRGRLQRSEGAHRARLRHARGVEAGNDPRPASWLDAAGKRWVCNSFRLGDVYARRIGALAVFGSQVELESTLDGEDWSGAMWVTDLWRKRRIGGWKMVDRALSRVEGDGQVPAAIRKLQLWR